MRKRITIAVGAALAGTVAAVTYPVATAGASGGREIRLTEIASQFNALDLGATGPSLGDEFVFASDLKNAHGTKVGTDGGYCVVVRVGSDGAAQCTATLVIGGDQLTGAGLVPLSLFTNGGRFTQAITGGTGRFAGAGGVLFANQISQTTAHFTIKLTG